jgi:cephalosporin hydroxylase
VGALLQAREVFMKQRWLGVAAMQQPFDFLAIADIIYEVQPDVILETGEQVAAAA